MTAGAAAPAATGGGFLTAANAAPVLSGGAALNATAAAVPAASSVFAAAPGTAGGASLGAAGNTATNIAGNAAAGVVPQAAKSGVLSTIMNSRATGPLLSAGIQGISGYMQGKQQQAMLEQTKPLSYWGAGARGEGGGTAITSPYGPGETLTGQRGQQPQTPSITNGYVPDPRIGLPNGNQWMSNLPNGNQGLMALGWDINTGAPTDPNDPGSPNFRGYN